MLTGEYLFDPKESRTYRKDEDHIAQMIELLGDFPSHFIRSGMYANEIFNSRGNSSKRVIDGLTVRTTPQHTSIDVLGPASSAEGEV